MCPQEADGGLSSGPGTDWRLTGCYEPYRLPQPRRDLEPHWSVVLELGDPESDVGEVARLVLPDPFA